MIVFGLIGLILLIVVGGALIGMALGVLKAVLNVINAMLVRANTGLDAINRRQAASAARARRPRVTTSVPVTHPFVNPWDTSAAGASQKDLRK